MDKFHILTSKYKECQIVLCPCKPLTTKDANVLCSKFIAMDSVHNATGIKNTICCFIACNTELEEKAIRNEKIKEGIRLNYSLAKLQHINNKCTANCRPGCDVHLHYSPEILFTRNNNLQMDPTELSSVIKEELSKDLPLMTYSISLATGGKIESESCGYLADRFKI